MSDPDVRVRLSAEGIEEVVSALRKIGAEAKATSRGATTSFGGLNSVLRGVKATLLDLVPALTVAAMVEFARRSDETAASVGRAAQSVGSSVKNFSVLAYGARQAELPMESLQSAMERFARGTTDAVNGSAKARASFAQLGISWKDLRGKDTAEQLDLVAQAFGKLKDSPAKTALAIALFGKSGAQMIPLLNELSRVGLAGLSASAHRLGLVFSDDVVSKVEQLNAAFSDLQTSAQVTAATFVAGMAGPISRSLRTVTEELGGAQSGIEVMGDYFSRLLLAVFFPLAAALDAVSLLLANLWNSFEALWDMGKAIASGNGSDIQAIAQWRLMEDRRAQDRFLAIQGDRLKAIFGPSEKPNAKPTGGAEPPPPDLRDRAAEAEKERQRKEQLRLQVIAFNNRLLEAEGQRHAAAMIDIEEQVAKHEATLRAQGMPKAQAHAEAERGRDILMRAEQFKALQEQARAAMDELDAARNRIESDVKAGQMSEADGNKAIAALELQRLPNLQAIATALMNAAKATNDPAAITAATAFTDSLRNLGTVAKGTNEYAKAAKESLEDFFGSGITKAKDFGDAMTSLALTVAAAFQKIAGQKFADWLWGLIPGFSSGGQVKSAGKHADGGLINGPGTPTSDSVPAWLSRGEYVVRASAVGLPGALEMLETINAGMQPVQIRDFRREHIGAMHFAEGGLVSPASTPAQATLNGQVTVGLEDGLVLRALDTPDGHRMLIRIVAKNRRAIGSALG